MADADVQGMLIRIEATTAQLRQEMAKADSSVAQATGKIDSNLGQVDAAFDRTGSNATAMQKAVSAAITGLGVASAAAVAGLVAITVKTSTYAQEVKNLSALSNTSVTDFQRLAAGAKTVGIEQDKLADILKDTSDRVGEFIQRGGGEMADFFKEIAPKVGVTAKMFADLSGPQALQLYYTSLEKAGLNQAQMTTYMEAMADEATGLIPLLRNNGEGFKTLGDQAERTGQVLSELDVKRLVEVNGAINQMKGAFQGASNELVVAMLPAIQSVTEGLNEMASGSSVTGALDVLAKGVGFLAENLDVVAVAAGGAAAIAMANYTGTLIAAGAAAVKKTQATIASAQADLLSAESAKKAALADQAAALAELERLKAVQAALAAERVLEAQRLKAQITDAGRQQTVARMAELRLTEAAMIKQVEVAERSLAKAQAESAAVSSRLAVAGRGLLSVLGGPAGIAALAVGAGIAFITLGDNTSILEKKLGDLSDPLDKLTERFDKLNRATQAVTLRELESQISDTQAKIGQMSGAMADKFENDLRNMGAAGADGLMAGLVRMPDDTQAALELVRKTSADQASGMVVDWKAVADQLRTVPGVTEAMAQALESGQGPVSDLSAVLQKQQQTLAALTGETDKNTEAQNRNSAAKGLANQAGEKYIGELTKQLQAAQDKTAADAANRFIQENTDLTEGQIVAIRSLAAAKDAQKAADDAATQATKDGNSAAKQAATEAKARDKALTDLTAKTTIETTAAKGLADAYFSGTDKLRQYTLEQKVEEALLKTGAGARAEVTAALRAEQYARDAQDLGKAYYDLKKETDELLAQATATLQGVDALNDYNDAKSVAAILAGKSADALGVEVAAVRDIVKANRDAAKAMELAGKVEGITDRLNPQTKLLREYTEEQAALNRAIDLYPGKADTYRDALIRLGNEYEVNRSKATLWGQMTEGAIDRIDGAFATAWGNIGSGANDLWDNLKTGFKQTLGEIAHMLTTKPLLASISNWLTGGDNGQGLSSVWGKLLGSVGGSSSGGLGSLFGGSSSSDGSGGGMWSSVVGLGKNLYSAWSSITGVGASAAAGYATGGIGGAASGVMGYYGSMLSGLTTTLSSGFSSLMTAMGLQTAATTAATAATTGAAAAGTGYALGGSLVSGTVGSATYAATTASAFSSAMASMGAMWPLAVVMGMYQSGKLYSAGVRPDGDAIQASGGDTALGEAAMFAPAMGARWLEMKDDLLGKVVGGKLAAIITGSTVFQAVYEKVGAKLFGSGYQTKDSGLALSVDGGAFDAQQYTKQKKKGGLISGSSKTRFLLGDLSDDLKDPLGQQYNDTILTVLNNFHRLNVTLNEGVLDNLNMATAYISTQGKTEEEINTALGAWFTDLGQAAVTAVSDATNAGIGNYNFVQLTEFVDNLYSVNSMFGLLNMKALPLSVWGGKLTEQFVAMAGGMEALKTSATAYYDAFFSDTEKADDTLAAVGTQFQSLGLALPATRAGFRSMVEGIDTATDAGRSMFFTLMGLSASASSAYSILEQRANEAASAQANYYDLFTSEGQKATDTLAAVAAQFKALGVVLPASRDGFVAMVNAIDRTTVAGQSMFEGLMGMATNADKAFDVLEAKSASVADALKATLAGANGALVRAIGADREAVTKAYNARVTSLNDMLSTANSKVSDLTGVSASLSASLKALRGDSDSATAVLRAQAQATLQSALATARAGGSLTGFTGLDDALGTVSTVNTDLYGSMLDFARDQGQTANVVAELDTLNGKQLTAQQQLVLTVQAQLDQAKVGYEGQMVRFDAQLAFAQSQLDALNGVDNSILGVTEAVKAMNLAVVAALAMLDKSAGKTNTPANNGTLVDSVYQAVLGRDADEGGKAYWMGQLASGAITLDQLPTAVKNAGIANGQLPAFATGGWQSGGAYIAGEKGPELIVSGPSQIFNNAQTMDMLGSGSDSALVAEVRLLRQEVVEQRGYLRQISASTGFTSSSLITITEKGIPAQELA